MLPPGVLIAALYGFGLALIFCEVFIPGGILGIVGFGCAIASMVIAYMNYPEKAVYILSGEFVGLIGVIILAFKIASSRLVLRDTQQTGTGDAETENRLESLVGTEGIADTVLRPSGMAEFEVLRISVVAEGEFIEKGTRIKVIYVDGNKVLVRAVEDE